MTLTIIQEGIKHATCILALSSCRVHILLLIACGDEAQLNQTSRHRRETQHCQIILLGTHILTTCRLTHVLLHILGQLHAVFHVLILNELKHDVALWRIGIVAMICLLIIFLKEDHGVLALGHFQILKHTSLLTRSFAGT